MHKWLENLHGFENICKLPVAYTFKDMFSKILQKVVLLKYFKFWFDMCSKMLIFNVPFGEQIPIFQKQKQKYKNVMKTIKF